MKSEKDIFKKANEVLDQAVSEAYHTDESSIDYEIDEEKYNWDNLQNLRAEIVDSIMRFVVQIQSLITAKEITDYLSPESLNKLNTVAMVFFKDIERFSIGIGKLHGEHKDLVGKITDMADFDKYNHLVIKYHAIYTELGSLVPPAVAEMMLIVHEAQVNREAQDTSFVTDIEPKQTEQKTEQPQQE